MADNKIVEGAKDEITVKLESLGVPAEVIEKIKADGVTAPEDLSFVKEADLVGYGMKVILARKVIAGLNPASTQQTTSAGMVVPPRTAAVSMVRLQEVPQASSWLASLSSIQPQRIEPMTVVTGIKASMADVYGFFQLPRKMMKMLRQAADDVGEAVPDLFFELQNLTQARRYSALVTWMQGKGAACTVEERNRFLARMHDRFWDSLELFYNELESWRKGRRESQDVSESLANAFSGEVQVYDATPVRNAALALGDSINRVFSGTGVYAATALALDNEKLQTILHEMDFRQFGVQTREQLLVQLGCAVPAEMMAAEVSISKFVWNAMLVNNQVAGSVDEQRFLIELASIGISRPWNQTKSLAAKKNEGRSPSKLSGIGSRRNREELYMEDDEEEGV